MKSKSPSIFTAGSRLERMAEQIESLHELGFVERKENVIFLGPTGTIDPRSRP
ncbi:MAG: hypothetical protein ACREKM_13245 [Longimicrobiales bacterium]